MLCIARSRDKSQLSQVLEKVLLRKWGKHRTKKRDFTCQKFTANYNKNWFGDLHYYMVSESFFGSRIEEVWRKFPVRISVDVITFDPLLRFKLLSLLQSFFSLYSPVLRGCFYCTVPFCSGWSGGRTVFSSPTLLCIRRCWGRRVEDATGPRPNTLHAKHDGTWSAHQLLLMLVNS